METSRRQFLKQSSILAAASALPAQWVRGDALPAGRKLKLRFAVASDLHYGQEDTPYAQMADDLGPPGQPQSHPPGFCLRLG